MSILHKNTFAHSSRVIMLSPAESVGLFGTTLDNRVRKAVQRVGDGTLARIADRLRIDAQANAVVYERNGVEEPVEKQRKQRDSGDTP